MESPVRPSQNNSIDPDHAERLIEPVTRIVRDLERVKVPKKVTLAARRAEDACRALAAALPRVPGPAKARQRARSRLAGHRVKGCSSRCTAAR
jgi:hypothetical protein